MIKDVILMKEHPNSVELFPFEGPRDLEIVTARPPTLFLSEPKASERFRESLCLL